MSSTLLVPDPHPAAVSVLSLADHVAEALARNAPALAAHWLARAQAATPRRATVDGRGGTVADGEAPLPAVAEPSQGDAEAVVRVLVSALRRDARPMAEVMRLGWRTGREGQAAGLSLRHIGRDADLLLACLLAEVERVLQAPTAPGTPAEAIAVARRLHQGVGTFAQAALSGFVHAFLGALRERYRLLRHDLRNPLGTIQSALSLMEDETVPLEMRQGPGVRAMVARNAGSLERLIAAGLDDAAATGVMAAAQEVDLRDVALAARREARDAWRSCGCEVSVEIPERHRARVDASALELALTALFLSAVACCAPGDVIAVEPVALVHGPALAPGAAAAAEGETAPVVLRLVLRPGAALDPDDAPTAEGVAPGAGPAPFGDPADPTDPIEPGRGRAACWAPGALTTGALATAAGDEPGPDRPPAPGERWDAAGLALAVSILADHGGRLTGDAGAPVGDGRPVRAEDVAVALAGAMALRLTLPVRAPGDPRTLRRRATDERPGVRL